MILIATSLIFILSIFSVFILIAKNGVHCTPKFFKFCMYYTMFLNILYMLLSPYSKGFTLWFAPSIMISLVFAAEEINKMYSTIGRSILALLTMCSIFLLTMLF